MKFAIVFAAIFGIALGANIGAVQRTDVRDASGQYAISYLAENGIAVAEQGSLVPNDDKTDNVLVIKGSFAFNAPDGTSYKVEYIADKNGFQPTGAHLPKPVEPIV